MSYRGQTFPSNNPQFNTPFQANQSTGSQSLKGRLTGYSKKIESLTDHPLVERIKPYTPSLARFCIVATFYEDSWRIITQWSDQLYYLWNYRHYSWFFVICFLFSIVVAMMVCSSMLILKKKTVQAASALILVVLSQALVYGHFTGVSFILRNVSVIGGLLIAISDSFVKNKTFIAGLPDLTKDNTKSYLLLAGRLLMVLMFLTFTFTKNWFTILLTLIGTVCIAVGFKTKLSSILMVFILTFYNVTMNNYWFYRSSRRDFLKYEFYQNLSIIGGLLLTVNTGAGELSYDEKKKIY